MKQSLERLIEIRKRLHRNPELSGMEKDTSKLIKSLMVTYRPDRIIEGIGGYGLAAVFNGRQTGASIMFRCELDALPITEINQFPHRSNNHGIAHKCGHDGHMTIMIGLAEAIFHDPPEKGRVILLFQPAEENGEGARAVIRDNKFRDIEPEYIFALHNLPGYPEKTVLLREGTFAAASKGMINQLYGKTSHAGEPEKGLSPALALAEIISDINFIPQNNTFEDYTLATVIHAKLGEKSFGTTPGYAEIMATLRSFSNNDMELLTRIAVKQVSKHANAHGLKADISWTEVFPATQNDSELVKLVEQISRKNHFQHLFSHLPFRWSEDFSNFTTRYSGVLMGLGAGDHCPPLHHPDYDFPDAIIPVGITLLGDIYRYFLK